MRVHGDLTIRRRDIEIKNWRKYRTELDEDFCGICGYCGKHFKITLCDSQIDHFRPKKIFPEYENLYSNLVLSCKVCNNKKRYDWPSGDPNKNIDDDNKKGYIDPATDEYDLHLDRLENGSVVGKTDVGKYMAKRLGFDYRPISECYKIKEIFERIEFIKNQKKLGESYDPEALNNLYESAEELRQYLHMKKE